MPLTKSKSKKAFSHNVEAEMHAGKPQRQAVAIAYAVQRKAKKAGGGRIKPDAYSPHHYESDWDYEDANGGHGEVHEEHEEEYKLPPKEKKEENRLSGRLKLEKKAIESGNKEEATKQRKRIDRRFLSESSRSEAKYQEKKGQKAKADTHRKEWETEFKKPAPFKAGGKVKHPNW